MKTRRNFFLDDDLWQQIKERAATDSRSATNLIEIFIRQGLLTEPTPDYSELVGLLLTEFNASQKINDGLCSRIDEKRLNELIEEFKSNNK